MAELNHAPQDCDSFFEDQAEIVYVARGICGDQSTLADLSPVFAGTSASRRPRTSAS